MIAYAALLLLIVGLFNCFNFSAKADKIFCGFVLFVFLGIVFWFAEQMSGSQEQIFSYLWNSSPSGDIKIDIISNTYTCELFFPFLIMSTLGICGNYCFRYEEKRCKYNATLVFNLLALLLMITSNNFVQLLSAFFLVDIFAVIKTKALSCKKFVILNLCADMIIFMILALINGRINSFDVREIINYKNMGYHLDFIALFGFTSVLMKMGFFPFQNGLEELCYIRFHRLQNILCLFSPISALIILLKFSPLWTSSPYFLPYFNTACLMSLFWSAYKAFRVDNLRLKIVYWQIMLFALLLELLRFHGFVWDWRFSEILLANYVLFSGVYLIYYQFGREVLLSKLKKITFQRFPVLLPACMVIALSVFSHINNFEMLYNNRNRYYIWSYAVLFLLSFCGSMHLICFAQKNSQLTQFKNKSQQPLFVLLLTTVCALLLFGLNYSSWVFWLMFFAFLFLWLSGFSSPLCFTYNNEKSDSLLNKIYRFFFVYMLQSIGILLWFIVERKFFEKFTTSVFSKTWQVILRFFRNTQTIFIWRFLYIITILAIVLGLFPYFGEIK